MVGKVTINSSPVPSQPFLKPISRANGMPQNTMMARAASVVFKLTRSASFTAASLSSEMIDDGDEEVHKAAIAPTTMRRIGLDINNSSEVRLAFS